MAALRVTVLTGGAASSFTFREDVIVNMMLSNRGFYVHCTEGQCMVMKFLGNYMHITCDYGIAKCRFSTFKFSA